METFQQIVREEGQTILGWREVPIDKTTIGEGAKAVMPRFIQVFIEKGTGIPADMDFERKLYIIRKKAEKVIAPMCEDKGGTFYFSSLSSKTIVYKGMLTAEQLRNFYLDLADLDLYLRWLWFIQGSVLTLSQAGREHIPTDILSTTAKSIQLEVMSIDEGETEVY